ncbi:MAG: transcriptional regulator [Silvibacterium sp.]
MTEPRSMPEIDRLVHEPARLAILTVLSACECADFLFLERATGLTRGNLSVQLTRLEEAGLIEIEKTIERKRTLTTAALVRRGRQALDLYWRSMEEMRSAAKAPRNAKSARGFPGKLSPANSVSSDYASDDIRFRWSQEVLSIKRARFAVLRSGLRQQGCGPSGRMLSVG